MTPRTRSPLVKIVGVGTGGANALRRFVEFDVDYELVAVDNEAAALDATPATLRVLLEPRSSAGPGANPLMGRDAALSSRAEIEAALRGADVVFIAAGLGGGTGTGAAPVVAEIARAAGALAVAVVTLPFTFDWSAPPNSGPPRTRGACRSRGDRAAHRERSTVVAIPASPA